MQSGADELDIIKYQDVSIRCANKVFILIQFIFPIIIEFSSYLEIPALTINVFIDFLIILIL